MAAVYPETPVEGIDVGAVDSLLLFNIIIIEYNSIIYLFFQLFNLFTNIQYLCIKFLDHPAPIALYTENRCLNPIP
jgi:hypothetical protein